MKWILRNKCYSCGGASSNPTILNWSLLMVFITLMCSELWALCSGSLLPVSCVVMGFLLSGEAKRGFQSHSAQTGLSLPTLAPWVASLLLLQPLLPAVLPLILAAVWDLTEAFEVDVQHWLTNGGFHGIIWFFDESLLKKLSTNMIHFNILIFFPNSPMKLVYKYCVFCLKHLLACPSFRLLHWP